MLATGQSANMSEIARTMGISRARVTQIMNLLHLPQEILAHVAALTATDQLRVFSERHLRAILAMETTVAQLAAFRQVGARTEAEA